MHVNEICRRTVVTCGRSASASEIARLMREHHIGDVIVTDSHGGSQTPVGIVTDRDLVVLVMAPGIDPDAFTAGDLMVPTLETVGESETVYDAIWHMRGRGLRRLPVVDAHNVLRGMLSYDDLVAFLARELVDLSAIAPRQASREQHLRPGSPA